MKHWPLLFALLLLLTIVMVTRYGNYYLCYFRFSLGSPGIIHTNEEIDDFCRETRLSFPFGS